VDRTVICHLDLDEAKVKQFKDAVENSYWLEFFVGMFFFSVSYDVLLVHCYNSFGFDYSLFP
jgi:hypothetical protein